MVTLKEADNESLGQVGILISVIETPLPFSMLDYFFPNGVTVL